MIALAALARRIDRIDGRPWTYRVRPYDAVADARRWPWQRPRPCGSAQFGSLSNPIRRALETAVERHVGAAPRPRDEDR